MKKQIALVTVLALAMSACASQQYQANATEPRTPANSESVEASVNAISVVSVNSVQWSADGVKSASVGVSDLAKAGANLSVAGVGVSKDVGTIVFHASEKAASTSKDAAVSAANFVVTSAGKVFDASINSSKSALTVSVNVSKEVWGTSKTISLNVFNASKTVLIGSVELSGKAAEAASSAVKASAHFVVDASGTLLTASGQVIGQVWDASKHVVSFVVEGSGKILTLGVNSSVHIVTSASENSVKFTGHVWNGIKGSANFSVDVVKASAQGSAVILRASGQSMMAISDSIGGLFQDKY